jgi:hypothetical protein
MCQASLSTMALVGLIAVGSVAALFLCLQYFSDKTYKPTVDDIRRIIVATVQQSIDLQTFDTFSCVRIAYDSKLEAIRHRYNAIMSSRAYSAPFVPGGCVVPINEAGKERLTALLSELVDNRS